jgi:hypothetical protein
VEDEADPDTIRQSREFMSTMLAPGIVVTKTGPATARPGDVVNYTIQISNQGPGPRGCTHRYAARRRNAGGGAWCRCGRKPDDTD